MALRRKPRTFTTNAIRCLARIECFIGSGNWCMPSVVAIAIWAIQHLVFGTFGRIGIRIGACRRHIPLLTKRMCTLTFVPSENGYLLGMNRDEKVIRRQANPPTVIENGARRVLYPRD